MHQIALSMWLAKCKNNMNCSKEILKCTRTNYKVKTNTQEFYKKNSKDKN